MTILYILVWAVLLALTIATAQNNNRSVLVWTFVGFVFSPLLSLIVLLLIGKKYGRSN